MFSVNDFITKYENYSDEELLEIQSNSEKYSDEAIEAVNIVIANRGGKENFMKRLEEKRVLKNEIRRITNEIYSLRSKTTNADFLKTLITSNVLSQEEVHEIIDKKFAEFDAEVKDKSISSRTIIGSITGGAIASVIGGGLWGLEMIYSNAIFYLLLFGLLLFCYGVIKLFTRQSKNNIVVLIATILSFVLALIIGALLFNIVGYQGSSSIHR